MAKGSRTYAVRLVAVEDGRRECLAVFHLAEFADAMRTARHAAEDGITAEVFDITSGSRLVATVEAGAVVDGAR